MLAVEWERQKRSWAVDDLDQYMGFGSQGETFDKELLWWCSVLPGGRDKQGG